MQLDADGLIGSDILHAKGSQIDMNHKNLYLGDQTFPFIENDSFTILARSNQIIYANIINSEQDSVIISELNMHPGIICGNALVKNRDGKAYIMCTNTSENNIEIDTPIVELLDYDIWQGKQVTFPEAPEVNYTNEDQASTRSSDDSDENDFDREAAAEYINKVIDLDNLSETERKHVQKLVYDYAEIFYIEGTKLKATPLVQHDIPTSDDFPIRTKQFRHPPNSTRSGRKNHQRPISTRNNRKF